jgi:hypothetical protein
MWVEEDPRQTTHMMDIPEVKRDEAGREWEWVLIGKVQEWAGGDNGGFCAKVNPQAWKQQKE